MKKICTVLIALLLPLCAAAQQNWKAVMRYDKQAAKTALSERLTKYAAYDTQADPEADKVPSSKGQTAFAKALAKELKNIGASNVKTAKNAIVTADIAATTAKPSATIAFIAYLDTTPLLSDKGVQPQTFAKYNGGDIVINAQKNIRLTEYNSPQLLDARSHDLITASGDTVLGADPKAGIAIIMTMADYLLGNPSIEHGPIKIVFIPDHANGRGLAELDIASLGADYAYIVNGSNLGEMVTENFNSRSFTAVFEGNRTADVGQAMNSSYADNLLMASDFHTLLPRQRRPETTADRRGFILVEDISVQGNHSQISGIIRAFSQEEMQELQRLVTQSFNTVKAMNPKATHTQLTWKDDFKNAKDMQAPQMVPQLQAALQQEDITPKPLAQRGPNAAAALTERGLPAISVFSGVFHPGSLLEYADTDVMEASLRSVLSLANNWAGQSAQSDL